MMNARETMLILRADALERGLNELATIYAMAAIRLGMERLLAPIVGRK